MNEYKRKMMDALLALHPQPDRYCPECYMRKDNCKCKQAWRVANRVDWALVPNGKNAKKPIHNVWSEWRACRKLRPYRKIDHGDRMWCVAISVPRKDLEEMGGINSGRYLAWKEHAFMTTPPMWHPVYLDMIGKRPKDLSVCPPFGRPRKDWEYFQGGGE